MRFRRSLNSSFGFSSEPSFSNRNFDWERPIGRAFWKQLIFQIVILSFQTWKFVYLRCCSSWVLWSMHLVGIHFFICLLLTNGNVRLSNWCYMAHRIEQQLSKEWDRDWHKNFAEHSISPSIRGLFSRGFMVKNLSLLKLPTQKWHNPVFYWQKSSIIKDSIQSSIKFTKSIANQVYFSSWKSSTVGSFTIVLGRICVYRNYDLITRVIHEFNLFTFLQISFHFFFN